MTIELIDINDFKEASFPGRWGKIGEDEWGAPTTTTIASLPPEVEEFHGRLGELVEQANQLLFNKKYKSVEELQKGRDKIISEYNEARAGYPGFKYNPMKEISDEVKEQIENELDAVIEEKEKAIQDTADAKKRKEKEEKQKIEDEKAEEERQVQEYINQAEQAEKLIAKLYQLPRGAQPREKLQNLHEIMIQMDRIPEVIKDIAKKGPRSQVIYDLEARDISKIYETFSIPEPSDAIVPQTRSREDELRQVEEQELVKERLKNFKDGQGKPPGDSSTPKTISTSECPCAKLGGGKNKRKKYTKNKRKKNTKNKRKNNTKRKFNIKNKRKKNTKNKRKKYTKRSKKKSTKRKNVRNR